MIRNLVLWLALSLPITLFAQPSAYGEFPLAHTYSIVAFDSTSGEMGVAVQSHWFSVGTLVSWGEAGVGVVATQSFVNPSFGPRGLSLLKAGLSPQQALDALIANDEGRDYRQVAILDVQGRVAAYTGKSCIPGAGHITGEGFSVQANLMANDKVWPAMAQAFEQSEGPLAERMLQAMDAAQAVGGDIRGKQSAAILVVNREATGNAWEDRVVDLRIADHATPLKEMRRLLTVHRAYENMNQGDYAVEKGDMESALKFYSKAESMFPENEEMKFWHAISLANTGDWEASLPLFKEVFQKNSDWKTLLPRLVPVGLLTAEQEVVDRILSLE